MGLATLVRSTGFASDDVGSFGNRLAFTLSNGNSLVLMRDPNSASGTNGDHTGVEKLYVYESDVSRVTWTLRATIAIPTATYRITAALFPDNSLAIWHMASPRLSIKYCKMTYVGYAVSAWEAVGATLASPSEYEQFDGCVSDTSVPMLYVNRYNTTSTLYEGVLMVKRTSDSTWITTQVDFMSGQAQNSGAWTITMTALGGTTTARNCVFATGFGLNNSDQGVSMAVAILNESTGVLAIVNRTGSIAAGEANCPSSGARVQSRQAMLFYTSANEYTLGIMHSEVNRKMMVYRGTWNGTTWTTVASFTAGSSGYSAANIGDRAMAMTYGGNAINFIYSCANVSSVTKKQLINYIATIDRTSNLITFTGSWKWNNNQPTTADSYLVLGGGDRNTAQAKNDTIFLQKASATFQSLMHQDAQVDAAPIGVTPASGSTFTESNPDLGADMDLNLKWGQSDYHIQWDFAKDSGFSTSLNQYEQDLSKSQRVDGTDVGTTKVHATDQLPLYTYTLTQGTWFMRAFIVDRFGNKGPASATQTFTISHPPSAANLSPSGGSQLVFGTGSRQFTWKFTDPSVTDYQTAYQVVVERNDTGATVYDSAKVVSSAQAHTATISSTYKDVMLQWHVKTWDRDDVGGSFTAYETFKLADPPTVTILAPTVNQVLTSGVPNVQFRVNVGGGRVIKSYEAYIMQGSTVIWSQKATGLSIVDNTTITLTGDKSYLKNLQAYSVFVKATDSTTLEGYSVTVPFTTSWAAPAAPSGLTVDASNYNVEDAGYVLVSWADTGRDVDFSGWVVYRRDDLINPATGLPITTGTWNQIYVQYNTGVSYQYRDYLAPSGYQVNYRVTQNVNRFGDEVESSNTNSTSVIPISDGYWLIEPDTGGATADAFKLSLITGDSYTDEWEEEEYVVIGRGRHVDRGQHAGKKGQLDAQIRDSASATARQKRIRLEAVKEVHGTLWLRNPFGDTFPVSVGDMAVTRIAGVGRSEFVDVSIPYSEVSQ